MKWIVSYMVDPGDGIVSKDENFVTEHDSILDALTQWQLELNPYDYFVVAIEAVPHD